MTTDAAFTITQNAVTYTTNKSVITLDTALVVTLTDTSTGPTSNTATQIRSWEIVSHSFDVGAGSQPALSSSTAKTVTLDPAGNDGMVLVKLTRTDLGVTTYAYVLLGFPNTHGELVPCVGLSSNLLSSVYSDSGSVLAAAGWAGNKIATIADRFLNRILRRLMSGATTIKTGRLGDPLSGDVELAGGLGVTVTDTTGGYTPGGGGQLTFDFSCTNAQYTPTTGGVWPVVPGTVQEGLDELASYTPGNAADWPVVPTGLKEALDLLAARVKALEPLCPGD